MVSGSYRQWEDGTAPLPRLGLPRIDVDGDAKLPGQVIDERAPRMTGPLPKLELPDYHVQEQWRDGSAPLPRVKRRRPRADAGKGEGSGTPAKPGKPEDKPGKSAKSKPEAKPAHREARSRVGAEEAPETPAPEPRNWPRTIGRGLRHLAGVVAFALIGLMLLGLVDRILSPYQNTSYMTDKAASFRSEPQNTVEVLFLGPSTAADGFSPVELWEEQGICSYNLATAAQPLFGSYNLVREAYLRHPETLRTVVVDCSRERYKSSESYERIDLDEVSLPAKLEPVLEWQYNPKDDKMVYLSSLYGYHNRWSELGTEDWQKLLWPNHEFLRGNEPLWNRAVTEAPITEDNLYLPKKEPDLSAEPSTFDEGEVQALRDLAAFCEEKGLNLVLMKVPVFDEWSDGDHVAMANLASELGLDFLDLNYEPFFSETGYNQDLDTREGMHPNDSGARKITSYIGTYLLENGLATDVRGDARYAFMDEQVAPFHEMTSDLAPLYACADPVSYLETVMQNPRYTACVGVDADGVALLSDEMRRDLYELGFTKLANAEPGNSYYATVSDGEIVDDGLAMRAEQQLYRSFFETDYMKPFHPYFSLFKSSDQEAIDALAYSLEPEEEAQPRWILPTDGVEIVVYDHELGAIVDDAVFRAEADLIRYADPQTELDNLLAAGVEDGDLPWYLKMLKHYNDALAETLASYSAQPEETPESAASVEDSAG